MRDDYTIFRLKHLVGKKEFLWLKFYICHLRNQCTQWFLFLMHYFYNRVLAIHFLQALSNGKYKPLYHGLRCVYWGDLNVYILNMRNPPFLTLFSNGDDILIDLSLSLDYKDFFGLRVGRRIFPSVSNLYKFVYFVIF